MHFVCWMQLMWKRKPIILKSRRFFFFSCMNVETSFDKLKSKQIVQIVTHVYPI